MAWSVWFNGLDDLKVALYVFPNHMDDDIHSDHSYLDTLGIPLNSSLRAVSLKLWPGRPTYSDRGNM